MTQHLGGLFGGMFGSPSKEAKDKAIAEAGGYNPRASFGRLPSTRFQFLPQPATSPRPS